MCVDTLGEAAADRVVTVQRAKRHAGESTGAAVKPESRSSQTIVLQPLIRCYRALSTVKCLLIIVL